MAGLIELEKRIKNIEQRNKKVESDKAWEVSYTRRSLLMLFTYLSIGFYLQAIKIPQPWLNAIVPAIAFIRVDFPELGFPATATLIVFFLVGVSLSIFVFNFEL